MPSSNTPPPNNLDQQLEEKLSSIGIHKIEEDAKALAQQSNLPYLNLSLFSISPSAITLVDESSAKTAQLAVIERTGKNLRVAVVNPQNPETQKIIDKLTGDDYQIAIIIVSSLSLALAWEKYEIEKKTEERELGMVSIKESEISSLQGQIESISDLK